MGKQLKPKEVRSFNCSTQKHAATVFSSRHFPATMYVVQSTLGLETLDKAATLGLETATPLTDPRQYINSNLGFRNLKI